MMNSAENFRHDASVSPDDRRDDDDDNGADKSPYDVPTGANDIHVYALPNNTRRLWMSHALWKRTRIVHYTSHIDSVKA